MIPIYICEDDPKQLEVISTVIKNRIMIENLDSYVHIATSDPLELFDAARVRTSSFGIYFLDIELKDSELDGVMIGKRIRDLDPLGKIIYVTSHSDLSLTILKSNIEPTDYIIKEDLFDLKERVEQILTKIFHDFQTAQLQKDIFKIEFNDEIKFLPIKDIQYFSTSSDTPHKLEVHLTHAQMQFYEKIKEIEKMHRNFIRCHKSYVINTQNVRAINKKRREITLANGEIIPASIRGLKKLI
ncbi:LytTR family DNA-binding domain-containing protein [Enterococcus sp. ZJ1622]|uniref:LytR/AlgR family response regulator transcription factor n=1 Tax=Enterococcus sp. ZJ1622 TaxID=2709401 RepID=UPI0013EBA2A6|nr:LytTR family DNA-binding domain-containing protein [Enterococcus sp. ZJ1622]